MPEHAEIRIMSEYADRTLIGRSVFSIEKNPISKMRFNLPSSVKFPCQATMLHRGKESKLILIGPDQDKHYVIVNYGMSAQWKLSDTQWQKHAMVSIRLNNGKFLEFVDPRRFGGLKYSETGQWSPNRGFDPVTESAHLLKYLIDNKNSKALDKPICEVMLNQKIFNGVGNYLRSWILHNININPFKKLKDFDKGEILTLASETKTCCETAYKLNGASLLTWQNPDEKSEDLADIIFYQKGLCCIDKTGRTFWFDEKWSKKCPYPYATSPQKISK